MKMPDELRTLSYPPSIEAIVRHCAKICQDEMCSCCWTDDAQAAAEHMHAQILAAFGLDANG